MGSDPSLEQASGGDKPGKIEPPSSLEQSALAAAESEVRIKGSVVEHGFSAVLITNADLPDPTIVYVNPAFTHATGYTQEIVGQRLSGVTALDAIRERLPAGLEGAEAMETGPYNSPIGERWGEWRVGPVCDLQGNVTHWIIILRDITERIRLEAELLEIGDKERQRIGQDLHDGICQQLAGIELMSQVLQQSLATRHKKASARAGEIARHVRAAISQTRLLARGLSPVTLESQGLMSALKELAVNSEKMFAVSCVFRCDEVVVVRDLSKATHLYRIAQEAVSNAIKHGKASHIQIDLRPSGNVLELQVLDDGIGLPAQPGASGMGLRIMQHRASVIGGSLDVVSREPSGVLVRCVAPRT